MALRNIRRASGTAGLRATTPTAIEVLSDTADSDLIKTKDSGGTVRTQVDTDHAQILTNKDIRKPTVVQAVDGAIAIATSIVRLTKGSAAAMTLAAPTAAQEGVELDITAGSAFAHVVTATSLVHDGITGGAKTTLTFGAFLGATITLIAQNLLWHVKAKNVVTIT